MVLGEKEGPLEGKKGATRCECLCDPFFGSRQHDLFNRKRKKD